MKQTISVSVPSEKFSYNAELGTDFNVFVGELIAYTTKSQRFELLGCEIKAPGQANANDGHLRSYAIYVAMNNAIFGNAQQDTIFVEGTVQYNWWVAINDVGIFGSVPVASKLSCFTNFKQWYVNKKSKMQGQVQGVSLANARREAQTKILKANNKVTKGLLDGTITGLVLELTATES